MKTAETTSGSRDTRGRRARINRRSTLLLGIGGMAGFASQSSPALAETPTAQLQLENLKVVGAEWQVVTIHHRRDVFEVVTADGRSASFYETDLRFKIDTSNNGPPTGKPVILPGGTMGDRATVFVSSPMEICTLFERWS